MRTDTWARIVLGVLAVSSLTVGLWAQFAPKSFYDSFPGAGRHWISVDGPYNEHLIRDVGGLNLALTVVTIAAFVWLGSRLLRMAAAAWIVYSVPHFIYHLNHLSAYKTGDKVANMVSLGFLMVLPLVLVWISAATSPASPDRQLR